MSGAVLRGREVLAAADSVMMLVVHVWHVRVPVLEPAMLVRMGVGLPRRVIGAMRMPVMRVMYVRVRMREHIVLMLMLVIFGEMQPHPNCHQGAGNK
jgi:hypothetical protein